MEAQWVLPLPLLAIVRAVRKPGPANSVRMGAIS